MPKKAGKSGLLSKLGDKGRQAFVNHRSDDTRYDTSASLPAGINGGIARLVDCKFDTYKDGDNKGKVYFYAAGVVVNPKERDGTPIEGLRTSIMEPLCDTPSRKRATVDDHMAWVLNELRKLGLDTDELGDDYDALEAAVEALREAGPHFRFRTWIGSATPEFPNPRVNEVWNGVCEYEEDSEDSPIDEDEEEEDLDALAKAADGGDEKAGETLQAKAEEAGIDSEEYATWAEVVAAMASEDSEEEEEEEAEEEEEDEEEEEEYTPEKGEVTLYKAPKTKKAIECEVTAVFVSRKTVNLKSLDDGKSFKAVPWDKLVQE